MKRLFFIFFLLAVFVGCGNNSTSKTQQIQESPYGDWEICDYLNDFDEPTGEKYVRLIVQGDFSNSATASSPLTVYIIMYHYYNSYSGKHYVQGKMRFDEYSNGTEDFHMWYDGSPAKNGTKIVDKPNHKAYRYQERMLFKDVDEDKNYYWTEILANAPSTYTFTVKGEYQDEYRFSVNTEKLNKALKDANILRDEE